MQTHQNLNGNIVHCVESVIIVAFDGVFDLSVTYFVAIILSDQNEKLTSSFNSSTSNFENLKNVRIIEKIVRYIDIQYQLVAVCFSDLYLSFNSCLS